MTATRLLTFTLILLGLAAATGAEPLVIEDDFSAYQHIDDAHGVWTPLTPDWEMRDGMLEATEPRRRGTVIWRTDHVFGDVSVTVRFRIIETGWGVRAPGIVLASADSSHYYYVHYDSGGSQVIIVRHSRAESWHELARARSIEIPRDTWHEARFELRGGELTAWLNGERILSASDASYEVGVVGLRAGQGHIQFDDLRVEGARATADAEWELIPESVPVDDLSAPRLTDAERVIAASGQGYFPVMIRLDNGDLGAVIRGGAPHIGVEGRLDFIRSTDGGRTWSEPAVIVDSEWDDRNPALGQMPDGTLVCAYAEAQTYNADGEWDRSAGKYVLHYVLSTDGGHTWSEKLPLHPGPLYGSPYGKIEVLPNGTALMSLYGSEEPAWADDSQAPPGARRWVGIVRSRDNGRTWSNFSYLSTTGDHNETALLALSDEHIIAGARNYSNRSIEIMHSHDGGYTWSEGRAVTEHQQHPADLIRLDSGNILLTFGNRREPRGVGAILSRDGGVEFDYAGLRMLEWRAISGDCGYPSSVQLDDGTIVTMYYALTLEDIEGREFALAVRYSEEMLSD